MIRGTSMIGDRERSSRICSSWPVLAVVLLIVLGRVQATEPRPAEGEVPSVAKADPAASRVFREERAADPGGAVSGLSRPDKQKGGLRLDARAAILTGGTTGPAVVPGNPKESLLVDAINYGETYQMPPKSKLPAAEIATLTDWVRRGAPGESTGRRIVESLESARSRPGRIRFERSIPGTGQLLVFPADPPRAAAGRSRRAVRWARNPIDRFILAALDAARLAPAPEAPKNT